MGNFLVSMTLESKITIVNIFIRLTTGNKYYFCSSHRKLLLLPFTSALGEMIIEIFESFLAFQENVKSWQETKLDLAVSYFHFFSFKSFNLKAGSHFTSNLLQSATDSCVPAER